MGIYIYTLSSPEDDVVRYIGYTNNINKRLKQHLKPGQLKSMTHKNHWIKNLLEKEVTPKIEILDEVDYLDYKYWEIFYINLFKTWNYNLVNGTLGGDGGNTISKNHPNYLSIVKSRGRKGRVSNRKGINMSIIQKNRISTSLNLAYKSGKKLPVVHTEKSKNLISVTQKENYRLGIQSSSGENNGMFGKTKELYAEGIHYKSVHICAEKLEVHYKTIVYRIKSKNYNYNYK